jgi:DNA repair protein RadC|tara:strand:- start:115 stop:789 length:675 start_codon:yes stop_codon:yes gene_type:complete
MSIVDWPADDRPREKLLARGAEYLSDAELLAIFLRTGVRGKSAVDLARDLLSGFGGLRQLLVADQGQFTQHHGLGPAKFAQLQAVLEMSNRHLAQTLQKEGALTSPQLTQRYLMSKLRDRQSEAFVALFLDSQHRIIEYVELAHGTIDGAAVYPREVVKMALAKNAAALIFAHNHPSGIAEASQADKSITDRLVKALSLLDIRVLDHIIIGDGEFTSFAEKGWL